MWALKRRKSGAGMVAGQEKSLVSAVVLQKARLLFALLVVANQQTNIDF
jgi:hypothetical protein